MTDMPTWEAFMIPTLRVLSDGVVRTRRELWPLVAREVSLTDAQMKETLSSGQPTYANRIGWGLSYLADLTEDPLDAALNLLHWCQRIGDNCRRVGLAELLSRLRGKEPSFFEDAVVQLLVAMGYGGTTGSGSVTQLTHDGGIDGVIDQDILGLSRVYIQAKRYADNNVVHRPEVQGFVGALHGKADSGVFITTSHFSQGAIEYVASSPTRIVMIDGKRLADLMIRYGVGVQVRETYNIVEIDEDFFA